MPGASMAAAISEAVHCGVSIAASAHGGSFEELMRSRYINELWSKGIFGICLGLLGRYDDGTYATEVSFYDSLNEDNADIEYSL